MLVKRRIARSNPLSLTFALTLLLLAGAIFGCGASTSIKNLLDDPSRFDGKTVQIAGEVTESIGVMGYGAYGVDDGTGVMTVLTKDGGAPRKGAKIRVKGLFHSGFTLGSTSLAVIQEEDRKLSE